MDQKAITHNQSKEIDLPEIPWQPLESYDLHNELLMIEESNIAYLKEQYNKGNKNLIQSVDSLISAAEKALTCGFYSVMYKTDIPPSGDKHDYFSLSNYWWPNPDTTDGLPYIRKDGQVNPEVYTDRYDKQSKQDLFAAVISLFYAYHYTENKTYLVYAGQLLDCWFLNPETRMNPHSYFAQIRPGRNEINSSGIIETVGLIDLLDCAALVYRAGGFSDQQMLDF